MDKIFTSAKLGSITLKNRIVRSATNEHLADSDGQITPEWADALINLAENEVALVITGHFCVDGTQRADAGQPVLNEATDEALLRAAANGVHHCGGKLFFQLSHSGIKAMESVNGIPPKHPENFSIKEIDQLVNQFAFAAKKCKDCGADGIQLHTAHGYLLSNFLNAKENMRTDEYGGNLENRFRIVARILKAMRESCGDRFPIIVKADSNGCDDLPALLLMYECSGVDGIELSGIDFNCRAGQKSSFYVDDVLKMQRSVRVPLFPVGGIFSRKAAEELLEKGIPFVSMSRALICEPDFAAKLKKGIQDESRCLACNNCYGIYSRKYVRCSLHTDKIQQLEKTFG